MSAGRARVAVFAARVGLTVLVTRASLALLLCASLSSCSCATAFVAQRPYPAPKADELMSHLTRRQAAVVRMNLETRTTSWLGGERLAADVPMMVERRGRLRFDPEISLQGTVASLITDGREFALQDLRKQVFQTGPACPENVSLLIRIPLLPTEIAAILLGDAPLPDGARATSVSWDGHKAADVLAIESSSLPTVVGGEATSRLWVSFRRAASGRAHIVAVEGEATARKGRWRVLYEEVVEIADHSFPRLIRFAEPGRDFDEGVLIKVTDRILNPPVRDQAFALVAPEGFRIEKIPCCRGCEAQFR